MSRNNKSTLRIFRAFILGILILSPALLVAQNRSLPILEANPDARSMAMGNVSLMSTDRNYLYVNPSSIFYNADRYSASVNGTIFPKNDDVSGRLLYGNASAAWRFADRHAAFIGYRYLGGEKIGSVTDQFGTPGKDIKPLDWSFDVGYSFKISDEVSAYATGSVIQSKTNRTANAVTFGVGANYRTNVNLGNMESQLNIAARVLDIGPPIEYSSNDKYDLPTSAQASADITMPLSDINKLNIAIGGRYFMLPTDATLFTIGAGAEYTYNNLVSARMGYNYGENESSRMTLGLGVNIKFLSVDAAYSIANDTDFNMIHVGLTARF